MHLSRLSLPAGNTDTDFVQHVKCKSHTNLVKLHFSVFYLIINKYTTWRSLVHLNIQVAGRCPVYLDIFVDKTNIEVTLKPKHVHHNIYLAVIPSENGFHAKTA